MSFVGTQFSFNNINSDDMGVMLVRLETGMLKRNFGIQKTINKEKNRYRDIPSYYKPEKQTYPIEIVISKINGNEPWTMDEWQNVAQWLFGDDNFHDFESEDYPDIIFPLQFISSSFNDNYNHEGYIELTCEMKSPYPYTRPTYYNFDLSDNDTTTIIEIDNISNVNEYYLPMFEAEIQANTPSFKVRNLTVGGEETIFTNLVQGEILNVDNQTQQIVSSTNQERISNFNFQFLRLIRGRNRLEITGKCNLTFKCSFPIML